MNFMKCWKCGKEFSMEQVHRTSECPECHADLHVCKGCAFYEQGSHYDCRETVDSPVTDKERSNFCDYFTVRKDGAGGGDKLAADKARNAFNSLFGD